MEINKPTNLPQPTRWPVFASLTSIAPLALLRIAFGAVMFISTIRFIAKGWVRDFYITPHFFFTFFPWIHPLSPAAIWFVFAAMSLASLLVALGLFYRTSIIVFFLTFTYIELLDKSYYLNHYYLVTLIGFLLIWVPAQRCWSLDVKLRPALRLTQVPVWTIGIFKAQLIIVYFCAGLSKLNPDWLLDAMPLKIWLPADASLPIIGPLLGRTWTAYAFSWSGAAIDLTIGFFLLWRPTRIPGYIVVILFHLLTGWLFKIGMFPYIMLAATVIFFGPELPRPAPASPSAPKPAPASPTALQLTPVPASYSPHPIPARIFHPFLSPLLTLYFILQLALPFRYLLYPGHLYWTEEGYRFSWRVMLMEKAGTAFFYVTDPRNGRKGEVINRRFLTPLQERMMQTQPDMILQYAHYLHDTYSKKGIPDPIVTVESYVTLNGSGSRLYIDSTVNLAKQQDNLLPIKWILPYKK